MAKNREDFIARQIEYTKERELAHIAKNIKDDAAYKKELIKLYNRAQDRIEKEISAQYLRYATKEGLTMDEAMLRISRFDADAFSKKAAELVKNMDFTDEASDLLRQYNLKMRVSRLELMKREMLLETVQLADQEVKMLHRKLIEEVQKEAERQASILQLTKETRKAIVKSAERIVRTNMYSASFSQRVWANHSELINRLAEGLERSILQGEHPSVWARNLRDLLTKEMADTGKENALYAANRIAVTETARVQSETALESFRKGGFEKMIWITEMDERTCDVCGPMDGEIFDVDGAQIGGELPPMHPFCRCSVSAYYEREMRRAKDQQAYDVRGIKKPKRPSFRDYPNGTTDENYIRDRAAYKRNRETYDELMNQQVDRSLKREFKYNTPERVLAAGRERGIEIDPGLLNGENDLRAFDELFESYDELRRKYPQTMKYKYDYEGRKVPAGINRIMKSEGDSGEWYYAGFEGDTLRLGDGMLKSYEDDMRKYLDSITQGHFSQGTGTYKNLFNHEFGHNVDDYIQNMIRSGKEVPQYLPKLTEYQNGLRKIYEDYGPPSEYGGVNLGEFFAETFSAYEGGEQTDLTRAFGKFLEGWL